MVIRISLRHEPRPRDFTARLRRSAQRGIGHRRRRRLHQRSALALLAAIAVPAFAQPGEWERFQIGDAEDTTIAIRPMPFEEAGKSFPGSAFYYLEAETTVPGFGEGIHSDADSHVHQGEITPGGGPVARALRVDNSGVDWTRAEQCLTAAIYYEAASEADSGQRAVAQVVLNRVAHPSYPNTVCGVVYQGSERQTGCQFSFTCDGSLARRPSRLFWLRAEAVARAALAGYVHAPAGLATHYHTVQVRPYWAPSLRYLGTIGAHRFYSFQGAAGSLATFRFAYGGGEPVAAPHRRDRTADTEVAVAALDPLAIQNMYEAPVQHTALSGPTVTSDTEKTAAPAPTYTSALAERGGDLLYRGDKLPEATGVRPEYRNSGRWIARPED